MIVVFQVQLIVIIFTQLIFHGNTIIFPISYVEQQLQYFNDYPVNDLFESEKLSEFDYFDAPLHQYQQDDLLHGNKINVEYYDDILYRPLESLDYSSAGEKVPVNNFLANNLYDDFTTLNQPFEENNDKYYHHEHKPEKHHKINLLDTITKFIGGFVKSSHSADKNRSFTEGLDVHFKNVAISDSVLNTFKNSVSAVYPGTIWCGSGNDARNDKDIGVFYRTDRCCMIHDQCPLTILPGRTWNRLNNNGLFTRSHCDCDNNLYDCLKKVNSIVSSKIGYTYFNLLRPQCFRLEHPILECLKGIDQRCSSYTVNEKEEKTWQWIDNKYF